MEFTGEKCQWKFMDEGRRSAYLPRKFSNEEDSQPASARTSCASAASSFPLCSASPETPWIRSPLHPASALSPPPLPYHCLASLHRGEGNVFSVAVTKDFIFTGSASSRIHVWRQPDCSEMGYVKASSGDIRAISARGRLVFTGHGDCRVRVWDVLPAENLRAKKIATLPRRRSFFFPYRRKSDCNKHRNQISCLAYNDKEKLLFTGSFDQTVKVWNVSEKRCIDSFIAHEGPVNAIAVNPEDGCVFTCSSDGTVKIWRRVSRESCHFLTMKLKFQPSPVNALALSLSPENSFLYSGSSDGLINFWEKDSNSGRYNHLGFLQGHHFAVLCLETAEDLILSGSEDATIRIWKREDGNTFHSCLAVIDGHHGPVKCLAAAMEIDGLDKDLLVYSASVDQTLKIWRVKVNQSENMHSDKSEGNLDFQLDGMESKMSPVLSPLWVQKKIQGSDY